MAPELVMFETKVEMEPPKMKLAARAMINQTSVAFAQFFFDSAVLEPNAQTQSSTMLTMGIADRKSVSTHSLVGMVVEVEFCRELFSDMAVILSRKTWRHTLPHSWYIRFWHYITFRLFSSLLGTNFI